MQVTGMVVRAQPARVAELQRRLAALAGVEVHLAQDDGHLVVTVEADDDEALAQRMSDIGAQDGVLSAALVYQYADQEIGEKELQS